MLIPKLRLPLRISPYWAESLRGYLMRAAEWNGLPGSGRLLMDAIGGVRLPVNLSRAVVLADYCRCDADEFLQLFGVEYRSDERSRQWRLGDEWITKDYFIRVAKPAICPVCLRESSYLRGQWDLSFYIACPAHGGYLLERCPGCHRALSPHRVSVCRCNCGYDLRAAPVIPASAESLWIAELVDAKVHATQSALVYTSDNRPRPPSIDRLASLHLNTLFKTLWLLGHCLSVDEPLAAGHGRKKLHVVEAGQIISTALETIADWPQNFVSRLEYRLWQLDPQARRHPETFLTPICRYLEREFNRTDSAFLFAAYEHFVREAWKNRTYPTCRRKSVLQLELF